jgi:hypothetical protein
MVDPNWEKEFRRRIEEFEPSPRRDRWPISIKIKPTSGLFYRGESGHAYEIIYDYVQNADLSDVKYKPIEHETGPEILVVLTVLAAGLGFTKSIVELITAIIKARSEGIKRGDPHREPLELIVRGYEEDGKFFQETVLRISPESSVTPKQIETALKKGISAKKLKRKSKTK